MTLPGPPGWPCVGGSLGVHGLSPSALELSLGGPLALAHTEVPPAVGGRGREVAVTGSARPGQAPGALSLSLFSSVKWG